jgi:RNA recognition motif-containing protein
MNLHISNLNTNIIESDLYKMFARFGEVGTVHLVRDKLNNRSRGRAFVEMLLKKDGENAILHLHRSDCKGKTISVMEVGYNPSPDAWTFRSLDSGTGSWNSSDQDAAR